MADSVVDSFLALEDKDERLQALPRLVMALTRPERDVVNAALSERNDFFAMLPSELTLAVFEYLDPADVWRLRMVSRRWNTCLSDRQFIQSAVSRWSTNDDSDRVSPRRARDLQQEVRHMQAFHLGRPFSRRSMRANGLPFSPQLQGRYLAYHEHFQGVTTVVTVYDLLTNASLSYSEDARDIPKHLVLTSTLVAFTIISGGHLYWNRLGDEQSQMRSVRLPSANVQQIAGDADLIVLLVKALSSVTSVEQIILFDASARKLQCVDISPGLDVEEPCPVPREWRMLVNAAKGFVDIFGALGVSMQAVAKQIHHFRVSLCGQRIEETVTRSGSPQQYTVKLLDRPLKTGRKGEYIIWVGPDHNEAAEYVVFNTNTGMHLGDSTFESAGCLRSPQFALWKGSLFSPTIVTPDGGFSSGQRCFQGTLHEEEGKILGRYKRTGCRAQDTIVEFKEPILLAVNESFLVCLEASTLGRTIQVFCFEEDIEMPEGQSTGLWD